ncbi:MAG: lysostaphin resistance A-like protein [Rubrobacteraceae bacterium]
MALNAALVAITLGAFWIGVFVTRRFGRTVGYSLKPLGFAVPKAGLLAGAGVGFLVGLGALVTSMVVNPVSAFVLDRLGYSTESTVQQPFMQGLEIWVGESPAVAIPAMIGVVVILGPAVEELIFRGVIFNGMYRVGGILSANLGLSGPPMKTVRRAWFAIAAVLSSAFFALLHFEPVILPALVILAVALCLLFERTGSLLPPFVAHATFNSFATSIIILSGLGIFEVPI